MNDTPPAAADFQAQALNGYLLRNQWAGRCLDNNNGGEPYLNSCKGNDRLQRWWTDGPQVWSSYFSHLCLDGNGGDDVYLLPCNGNQWQRWWMSNLGQYVHAATGKCLDTNGTALYKLDCDFTNRHQMWTWLG